MKCACHPEVDTELSCIRCETPICPRCLVQGAVGMLCKSCAGGGNILFQVPPARMALAGVLGLVAGVIAGIVTQQSGFFLFFISTMVGGGVGQVILWATKGRRGPRVEILTGVSVALGGILSLFLTGVWRFYWRYPPGAVWFVLGMVLCTGAAIARVRRW